MTIQCKSSMGMLAVSPVSVSARTANILLVPVRTGTVRVWDTQTGQVIRTLVGHVAEVYSVCFSPDGQSLASSGWDHAVKIWDTETGQVIRTFQRHRRGVASICFSPDGKYLASSGSDCTIMIWNVETGQEARTFLEKCDVFSICFSPDGKYLASSGSDCIINVRDLSSWLMNFTIP